MVPNIRALSMRSQGVENHINVVALASAMGGRSAEITAEDGRQGPVVGEIEITDRRDGDVDIDRIESGTEHAFGNAATQDVIDQFDEWAVQLPYLAGAR